jgi:ABC-2 type transport system ATP-binding protein
MDAVVSLRGIVKRYGPLEALAGIDLDVRRGEILGLLGPNGAGKTTLIGIVAGMVRATAGTATVLGKDVVRDYRETRRAVGLVPQEINFDPFFTVEESLRIQAGYFGVRLSEARLVEILDALDLAGKRKAMTRTLSGGMKRRLLIGKALVHDPRVLFLDEPTAGVDVELRQALWRYVRTLRSRGTTIVLTTHYLEEAEELADRIGVLDRGRLLLVEEKAALVARHEGKRLQDIYVSLVSRRQPAGGEAAGSPSASAPCSRRRCAGSCACRGRRSSPRSSRRRSTSRCSAGRSAGGFATWTGSPTRGSSSPGSSRSASSRTATSTPRRPCSS